jgi:hypothetical protein
MELEMAVVFVLGLLMGSVLGYWSVLLRVWRLEKELAQAVVRASVLELVLESRTGLDSEWVWVQKSEWESVKVRQSELEMALDYQRSKAMGKE